MKVIRKGPTSSAWQQTVTCNGFGNGNTGCKATLEVQKEDVYKTHSYFYDGSNESYFTIMCPICGSETDLKDIPYVVSSNAPDKKDWQKMKTIEGKPEKLSINDIADFPKKGILFKDISPLLANPEEFHGLIKHIAKIWKSKVDKIGGFDARGFIFASALAYEMKLPFFMLRKKGKLPGETISVEYGLEYGEASLEVGKSAVSAGDKVLLVDDVLATGGTAEAGCKLVESLKGEVIGLQFIAEIKDLSGKDKLTKYNINCVLSF